MAVYNQTDFTKVFHRSHELMKEFSALDGSESIFKVNLISKRLREAANEMSVIMEDLTRQGLLTNINRQMWGAVNNLQKRVDDKIYKMLLALKIE